MPATQAKIAKVDQLNPFANMPSKTATETKNATEKPSSKNEKGSSAAAVADKVVLNSNKIVLKQRKKKVKKSKKEVKRRRSADGSDSGDVDIDFDEKVSDNEGVNSQDENKQNQSDDFPEMTEPEISDGMISSEDLSDDAKQVKMNISNLKKNHRNKPEEVEEEAPAGDNSSDVSSNLPSEFDDNEDYGKVGQKRNFQQANSNQQFGGNSMNAAISRGRSDLASAANQEKRRRQY